MAENDSITVRGEVGAPASEVYRYFTNPTLLREWFSDVASTRITEGGRVFLGWDHGYGVVGNFTTLVPGKQVSSTWIGSMDPGASAVSVMLEPAAKGTRVTITHSWPRGEGWEQFRRGMQRTWERSLENLASVMETGQDLRFTRRPMLGVMVDAEINPERAAKHGIPVDYGVLLSSTAEGMGARAAGLTGGDVVVRLGDTPITSFGSFAIGLQQHRAGDTVEVVYYREGKEHRAPMTLSGRPIPDVPDTAAALAEYVADLYRWVDGELAKALEGATDAELTVRPAPDEWSGREVLAHLLDGEGDGHAFIADLVLGAERVADGPFDNSHLRTRVTADSFATVAEMVATYHRLEQQTVALLAALPDDFVARKGSFWRLAYSYTQGRQHYEDHFGQIRAAIEAARAHPRR